MLPLGRFYVTKKCLIFIRSDKWTVKKFLDIAIIQVLKFYGIHIYIFCISYFFILYVISLFLLFLLFQNKEKAVVV